MPNIASSWNVAPTDPLPVVRYDAKDCQRSLEVMRWGLVPFWAKDIKVGFSNINAGSRSDEVSELLIRLATVLPSARGRGEPCSSAPYGCLYQPCPGRALAMT
jgi:hypothetical protein